MKKSQIAALENGEREHTTINEAFEEMDENRCDMLAV